MPNSKGHLEDLLGFIKEHRSNESNFEKIYEKLEQELSAEKKEDISNEYYTAIEAVKEKQAEEYRNSIDTNGITWPEFEKFVTAFEKAITGTLSENES